MSIYTTTDRHLCCPLCGGPTVSLDEARITDAPGHRITLIGSCADCTARFGLIFTADGPATRTLAAVLDRDPVAADQVKRYWLGDPDVPWMRRPVEPIPLDADSRSALRRQDAAQPFPGTRVTPGADTASERRP